MIRKVMTHKVNSNKCDAISMCNSMIQFCKHFFKLNLSIFRHQAQVKHKDPQTQGYWADLSLGRSSWGVGCWGTAAGCSALPRTLAHSCLQVFRRAHFLLLEMEGLVIRAFHGTRKWCGRYPWCCKYPCVVTSSYATFHMTLASTVKGQRLILLSFLMWFSTHQMVPLLGFGITPG